VYKNKPKLNWIEQDKQSYTKKEFIWIWQRLYPIIQYNNVMQAQLNLSLKQRINQCIIEW